MPNKHVKVEGRESLHYSLNLMGKMQMQQESIVHSESKWGALRKSEENRWVL